MKKGILLTLCSIVSLASFTGCGNEDEGQENVSPNDVKNRTSDDEEGIANIFVVPIADFQYNILNSAEVEITGVDGTYDYLYIPNVAIIEDSSYTITKIGNRAFANHTEISNVEISSGIKSIGHFAFLNCSSLLSIEIPSSVSSIGTEAFRNCTSLTDVTIQQGVASIGVGAFYGCENLTSIDIPASVTSIGVAAFYECNNITSYTVAQKNPNYTSIDGVIYDKALSNIIEVPNNIKGEIAIPKGITNINDGAFSNRQKLTHVEIPEGVTYIGKSAFSDCTGLKHITIPSSVNKIDEEAFSGCRNLEVEIDKQKLNLGAYAFYGCKSVSYKE